MIQFKVPNHLIVPFGSPKWEIENIRISGVSTTATYFASETPVAYIDVSQAESLRIWRVSQVFPDQLSIEPLDGKDPDDAAWEVITEKLRGNRLGNHV